MPDYSRREKIEVAALTALAAALFFFRIGHTCFWTDEGCTWTVIRDWRGMWEMMQTREANMWLYYVLVHGWMRLFGDSAVALRSFSALAAAACVPVVYATARLLMSRRAAVTAALLLIASPFLLRYAQEARGYSLLCLTSAISLLLFVRIFFFGQTKAWPFYAFVTAAGVWIHFHGVFVPAAQGVFFLLDSRRARVWKPLVSAWFLMAVLLVPIPLLQPLFSGQVNHLARPGWLSLPALALALQGSVAALVCLAVWVGLAGLTGIKLRRSGIAEDGPVPGVLPFLALSVVGPVVAVFVISIALKPLWEIRYFTFLIPAFCLAVPAVLERLPGQPRLFWIAAASLLIAQAAVLPRAYQRQNDRWDNVVRYLAEKTNGQDAVLLEEVYYQGCYLHAGLTIPGEPLLVRKGGKTELDIRWLLDREDRAGFLRKRYPRLWLVVKTSRAGLPWSEVNRAMERLDKGYVRKDRMDFSGLRVFLFEARPEP